MKEEERQKNDLNASERVIVFSRSFQTDVVDGIYKVHTNEPIHDISNEFCKYFHATNLENGLEYFAVVFDRYFSPSLDILQILKNNHFKHLNNLITYSIVKLSYSRASYLVAIIEKYDIANNLGQYIEKNGPLSIDQISKKFIPQISRLLEQCEKNNINCGNISPYNIIIDNEENFLLREFFSSYASFNQPGCYLAPEITECAEAGRKIMGLSADIYAFSICVFYCLTGRQPWTDFESLYKYNESRFEYTTFKLLTNKRKISEYFKTFFKGTMHNNASFRWKVKNIFEWLTGNSPKISLFEKINENTNLISFKGANYGTSKSIAYALFCNWEEALTFIQEDKILKWLKRQQITADNIEDIQILFGNAKMSKNALSLRSSDRNGKLIKLLLLIDPEGPIRQQRLAISTISIPSALHYFLVKNKREYIELIIKALQEKYWKISQITPSACSISSNKEEFFEEVINSYSSSSPVFGIERVMYSLNEYAPCLSPVVINDYIVSLPDLLIALDKIASQSPEKFNIDRHIMAFIAAKINLKEESKINILTQFPKFSDHPFIYGLYVLNIAQQNEPEIQIPNLCNIMTIKIIELFEDYLHNIRFKERISSTLKEVAKGGTLSRIVEVLSDPKPFIEDYNGYYKACKEIQNLKKQIEHLNFEDKIFENALLLGQKLTVLMSYILCFIVTVILTI